MESLLNDQCFKDATILRSVFQNMSYLVKGVESDSLKPFLVESLRNDIEKICMASNPEQELKRFQERVGHLKDAIVQLNQTGQKEILYTTVEIIHDDIPDEAEEMFEALLDAICELPTSNLERMTTFSEKQKVNRLTFIFDIISIIIHLIVSVCFYFPAFSCFNPPTPLNPSLLGHFRPVGHSLDLDELLH